MDFHKIYKLTKNCCVLYVEDDKKLREETSEVFEDLFQKTVIAIDGKQGLEKYLEFHKESGKFFDLVITDVVMPHINGVELTKKIYEINKEQLIIVVSAYNEPEDLIEFVNIGIEHFLTKPLDYNKTLDVLYQTVRKIPAKEPTTSKILLKDNYYWDKETQLLFFQNNTIKLTKKETHLMEIFIKNGSQISKLEEIHTKIWSDSKFTDLNTIIKPVVSRLRKKLPKDSIENIYGLGYRLIF
ncbi:MAG: response regulator transcription factor [Campylobacterales bacterium]|nr:response regulator transcription factor [Campylobacterales bacterium]